MSFHVPDVSGYVMTGPPLVYRDLQFIQSLSPQNLKLRNHLRMSVKKSNGFQKNK